MRILVTGGAGFIRSALVRYLISQTDHTVLNFDNLTYAASPSALTQAEASSRYRFVRGDIRQSADVKAAIDRFRPEIIVHLAAESHVDRSIRGPLPFVETNTLGTGVLLVHALAYWQRLSREEGASFRFLHVSTDEVYGTLGPEGLFTEETAFAPRSPYSASKAGGDHLASAWHHTFGFPVLLANPANTFGPYQHPEKLIPKTIACALSDCPIPLYGNGEHIRDWLFVDDLVSALERIWTDGTPGRRYNIGARNERRNRDLLASICSLLDAIRPRADKRLYRDQIIHVADRPGHDRRYALDPNRIEEELGWSAQGRFEDCLAATVEWYVENPGWLDREGTEE